MRILFIALATLFATAVMPGKAKAASCYAYTRCYWGGTVSCQTYGDACTWYTNPGQNVSCTGLDALGRWVNLFFSC